MANIIMLGAYAAKTDMFTVPEIIYTLEHVFESKQKVL